MFAEKKAGRSFLFFSKTPQFPSIFFTLLLRKSVKMKNEIVSTYKSIPFFLKKIHKRLDKGVLNVVSLQKKITHKKTKS